MGLYSIPPVFLQYKDRPEFTRAVYWTRSDKDAGVSARVYGMIPLNFNGSHKITSLRVTGSNPVGGVCHVSIWENHASNGRFRRSIVGQYPTGAPFDTTASPSGGHYVTNPTDYNYALWAYASGSGVDVSIYAIQVDAEAIG